MISFVIPRLHRNLYQSINTTCEYSVNTNIEQYYLKNIEKNIKNVKKEWDIYKKLTNTYELLYSQIPFESHCVGDVVNTSRTFFIVVEILHKFYLPSLQEEDNINTFHFSDKTNGMMDALIHVRTNGKNDTYTTFENCEDKCELLQNKKSFILKNKLLDIDNFINVIEKYKSSIDFITADIYNDGYDPDVFIHTQICYALCIQKLNGNFTLKLFDTFTNISIDIMGLLSSMYEEVFITKPSACKNYNSETYLVCKKFLHNNNHHYTYLLRYLKMILSEGKLNNKSFFSPTSCINEFFSNKIKEYSTIFTQYQIEHIHNTLNIIATDKNKNIDIQRDLLEGVKTNRSYSRPDFEKSKVHYLNNVNIKKCIQFCSSHNIEINKNIILL